MPIVILAMMVGLGLLALLLIPAALRRSARGSRDGGSGVDPGWMPGVFADGGGGDCAADGGGGGGCDGGGGGGGE